MSDLAGAVDGLVHEETQVRDTAVDLTAADVQVVTGAGRVDFGGGELEPAAAASVEIEKRDPSNDYGWWNLDAGQYLLAHNETLAPEDGERLVVQTRDAVRARGAFHPTLQVRELGTVPLAVGGDGLRIKENARVSTVVGRVERS